MPFSCAGLGEADAGRGSDQARLIVYLGVVFRGLADGLAPQFAVTVVSPAVEVAVRTDGQRVVVACADLGEVDTIWRSDKARRALFFFRGSQYVVVVSPAVEVAVRSDGLGTFYFCRDNMAEAYLWFGGRGQGDLGVSCGFPRGGGEAPGAGSLGPVGGQGQVCGDRLCEVVGHL